MLRMGVKKRKHGHTESQVDMARFKEDATQSSNSISFWQSPEDPYFFPSDPETEGKDNEVAAPKRKITTDTLAAALIVPSLTKSQQVDFRASRNAMRPQENFSC